MFVNNSRSNKLDMILEHFLIDENDNRSIRELRKLSEGEKTEISKQMVDSMTMFTLNRMKKNDYTLIAESKGDITRFEGYKNLKESISLLKTLLLNTNGDLPLNELATIEKAITNLENQKPYFTSAYKLNKRIVEAMYENVTTALICSVSFLIATSMDYVKDMTGSVKLTSKSIRNEKNYPTMFLKNLELYNEKSVGGEMAKFFEVSLKSEKFAGTSFAVLVAVVSIIPLLREIVYQYYYTRVHIATYLATQARFIELNQKNLKSDSSSAKKQQEIANKLLKLSEKIDVDQKASSKRAQNDVVRENSKMTLGSPSLDQGSMDFLL